jgi:2,3,4,5-tetrahydropyridine-2-carboxylate N-succinyltransferase
MTLTSTTDLLAQIDELYEQGVREPGTSADAVVQEFLRALESGVIRAATRSESGEWSVNTTIKRGILVAFRIGRIVDQSAGLPFADKSTLGVLHPSFAERGIRIVPGGSSIRSGAYIGDSVTIMPPAYINVGAWVGAGTMVDSHALVGSCAQVGAGVHLSASAQLGGVLEPIGMRPVVIEDHCLIGGNTGVYEGTLVREGAVLGAGVILTASTPVYDLVRETIHRATSETPLEIPAGAVVIAGSRPVRNSEFAAQHGLSLQTPVIVKYRDDKTDLRAALEGDLR